LGKITKTFLLIILLVAVLTSCTQIQPQPVYQAISWQIKESFKPPFTPEKCLYSSLSQIFILQKGNYLHFFKDGKELNRIGGLGYDKDSFSKLSDFKLAPDGNLLVLDSFAKKLIKFDLEGKWIADFSLIGFSSPTLFTLTSDETFFIYDKNRNEIFIVNDLNRAPDESFGQFELENPTSLQISKSNVVTYDKNLNKTFFYDLFGSFHKEEEGFLLEERGLFFQVQPNFLEELSTNKKFAISPHRWHGAQQINGSWLLWSDQKILLGKISYETKP